MAEVLSKIAFRGASADLSSFVMSSGHACPERHLPFARSLRARWHGTSYNFGTYVIASFQRHPCPEDGTLPVRLLGAGFYSPWGNSELQYGFPGKV